MDPDRVQEFAEKVAADNSGASATLLAYLGDTLGLWAALAGAGEITVEGLADRTGLGERHLDEWLSSVAVAGYVRYDHEKRTFALPAEHAAVLVVEESPAYQAGGLEVLASMYASASRIAEAFRAGTGVAWREHDDRLFSGVARFFRPLYRQALVQAWLPALEGVTDRLAAGASVLDVGCGHGTSTIMMAEAFPASRFTGVDLHEPSIRAAQKAAAEAGVADRITFTVGDALAERAGDWDLICVFDAFHHFGDPVAVAAHARRSLATDGTLLLVEPFAAGDLPDRIGDPVALSYYTASTFVCTPDALADGGGRTALGGQAGFEVTADILREAGFTRVRAALETPFNLVIEARP